ncbi:MAG: TolC family protein [Spirochaetales bacterium]|nr:TolC family protein [Spirochaetales bacterium]
MRIRRLASFALLLVLAGSAGALDLPDVLQRIDQTSEIAEAEAALDLARAELGLARFAGDISFGLQPGVTVSTPETGPFADEIKLSASASVSAPVGLSDAQSVSVEKAAAAVMAAERAVERAYVDARFEVFLLYEQAWLAQMEQETLAIELETARQVVENNERLFESGLISLVALAASEEDSLEAEISYLENSRDRRITWLELAYKIGLDPTHTLDFEAPVIELGDLPLPPELTDWALRTDPAMIAQRERIADLESLIVEPVSRNPVDSIRASLSAFSHTVAVTYNTGASSLSGSYSFIAAIGGSDETSGPTQTWDIGLSVSLGIQTQRERALELETLTAELEKERERLLFLEDVVTLQVRAKYQQYLLTQGAAEQSARVYEHAQSNLELVQERFLQDRATQLDVVSAETQLVRAETQLTIARAREQEAKLAVAAYSGYLPELWQ